MEQKEHHFIVMFFFKDGVKIMSRNLSLYEISVGIEAENDRLNIPVLGSQLIFLQKVGSSE